MLALVLLAACGLPAQAAGPARGRDGAWPGCGPISAVTAVSVNRPRTRLGPSGGFPALTLTSGDTAASRRLYRAACRLVEVNSHPRVVVCPADWGVVYTIRFRSAHSSVATAAYAATGCHSLRVRTATGARSTMVIGSRAPALEPAFRSALAAVLHVSVAALS